jgi:hypothetical protein
MILLISNKEPALFLVSWGMAATGSPFKGKCFWMIPLRFSCQGPKSRNFLLVPWCGNMCHESKRNQAHRASKPENGNDGFAIAMITAADALNMTLSSRGMLSPLICSHDYQCLLVRLWSMYDAQGQNFHNTPPKH